MKRTITLAALYLAHALASPTSITGLQRRDDPSNVKNLPDNDKDCNGRTHSSDDIKTAISFAWNAVKNGNTYQWTGGKKPSKNAVYPHRFTPVQMDMQWSDFNLDGCAQPPDGSENDPKWNDKNFQEFPITGGEPWDGKDSSSAGAQGNDRVIFQYVDSSTVAFCGIVRHPGADGVDNHFQLCEDAGPSNTAPVAPYATGTCSLHLTQWDYGDPQTPRYDVEVKIFDAAKNQIGFQERTGSQGDTPVYVSSALEDDLTVRAESDHDYIAFVLPNQSWPSNGKYGPNDAHNSCSVGGWDGSDYPPYRQMDCSFTCGWGGGESSDLAENDD